MALSLKTTTIGDIISIEMSLILSLRVGASTHGLEDVRPLGYLRLTPESHDFSRGSTSSQIPL